MRTFERTIKIADLDDLIEQVFDTLWAELIGFTTAIEVIPGGHSNGIDYGPVLVEIVNLESEQIAYRESNDDMDGEWQLATIQDACELAVLMRDELSSSDEAGNDGKTD